MVAPVPPSPKIAHDSFLTNGPETSSRPSAAAASAPVGLPRLFTQLRPQHQAAASQRQLLLEVAVPAPKMETMTNVVDGCGSDVSRLLVSSRVSAKKRRQQHRYLTGGKNGRGGE